MIRAVVFDLGGTLIEYAGPYDRWPELETPGFLSAYVCLQQQGVKLPAFEVFRDTGFAMLPGRWRGATTAVSNLRLVDLLVEVLAAHHISEADCQEAAQQYQAAIQAQATLLPFAQETLAALKTQGYKLGLISNTMFTGQAHLEDLQRFGLFGYFDAMLFSADVNKWKPNLEPFEQVLGELGVGAETAVFVGDDPANDVVGGQRAGMKTIHLRSSRFTKPNGVQAHAEINTLSELHNILVKWQA